MRNVTYNGDDGAIKVLGDFYMEVALSRCNEFGIRSSIKQECIQHVRHGTNQGVHNRDQRLIRLHERRHVTD